MTVSIIVEFTVGQAILPAAPFQAALSGRVRVFTPSKGRLKAAQRAPRSQDWRQDWLPHKRFARSDAHDRARGLADDGVGGHVQSSQDAGGGLAADHQQIGLQFPGQVGDHR